MTDLADTPTPDTRDEARLTLPLDSLGTISVVLLCAMDDYEAKYLDWPCEGMEGQFARRISAARAFREAAGFSLVDVERAEKVITDLRELAEAS